LYIIKFRESFLSKKKVFLKMAVAAAAAVIVDVQQTEMEKEKKEEEFLQIYYPLQAYFDRRALRQDKDELLTQIKKDAAEQRRLEQGLEGQLTQAQRGELKRARREEYYDRKREFAEIFGPVKRKPFGTLWAEDRRLRAVEQEEERVFSHYRKECQIYEDTAHLEQQMLFSGRDGGSGGLVLKPETPLVPLTAAQQREQTIDAYTRLMNEIVSTLAEKRQTTKMLQARRARSKEKLETLQQRWEEANSRLAWIQDKPFSDEFLEYGETLDRDLERVVALRARYTEFANSFRDAINDNASVSPTVSGSNGSLSLLEWIAKTMQSQLRVEWPQEEALVLRLAEQLNKSKISVTNYATSQAGNGNPTRENVAEFRIETAATEAQRALNVWKFLLQRDERARNTRQRSFPYELYRRVGLGTYLPLRDQKQFPRVVEAVEREIRRRGANRRLYLPQPSYYERLEQEQKNLILELDRLTGAYQAYGGEDGMGGSGGAGVGGGTADGTERVTQEEVETIESLTVQIQQWEACLEELAEDLQKLTKTHSVLLNEARNVPPVAAPVPGVAVVPDPRLEEAEKQQKELQKAAEEEAKRKKLKEEEEKRKKLEEEEQLKKQKKTQPQQTKKLPLTPAEQIIAGLQRGAAEKEARGGARGIPITGAPQVPTVLTGGATTVAGKQDLLRKQQKLADLRKSQSQKFQQTLGAKRGAGTTVPRTPTPPITTATLPGDASDTEDVV
jgi:hypothetical protein